jgi:hypothetical protein
MDERGSYSKSGSHIHHLQTLCARHDKKVDKPPTKRSLKEDKLEYLRMLEVPCEHCEGSYSVNRCSCAPNRKRVALIRSLPHMATMCVPFESHRVSLHQSQDHVRSHSTLLGVQEGIKGVTTDVSSSLSVRQNTEHSCWEREAVTEGDGSDDDVDSGRDTVIVAGTP